MKHFSEVVLRFTQSRGDEGLLFPKISEDTDSYVHLVFCEYFFSPNIHNRRYRNLWTEPTTIFVFIPVHWLGALTCHLVSLGGALLMHYPVKCFSFDLKKNSIYFYFFREKYVGEVKYVESFHSPDDNPSESL